MNRVITLLVSLSCVLPLEAAKVANRSIATVNGEAVLQSEFEKNWSSFLEQQGKSLPPAQMTAEWKHQTKEKIMSQMIDDKILLQEAKKKKLRINQREFENGILQVKARFLPEGAQKELSDLLRKQAQSIDPNDENASVDFAAAWKELSQSNPSAIKECESNFAKELTKEGIDKKKFEDRIRDQLSVVQLVQQEVRSRSRMPSEEDVKKLFDNVQRKLQGKDVPPLEGEAAKDFEGIVNFYRQQVGEKVRARHILIAVLDKNGQPTDWEKVSASDKAAAQKKAQDLLKKVKAGADFAELAEKNSDDKGSAIHGGDLGTFTRGQMVPPFEKAAFALNVGQTSGLVETRFGIHIIRVEGKNTATKLRFEDAENDLRDYLMQMEKQKTFETYISDLRKGASVKILATVDELGQ